MREAHNSSQEAIQEATLSVKSQLTDTRKEVESLRSQLISAQGSLDTEKQKALTLTSEKERLNGQLHAKTEELNAVTINLNAQLNALQQRLHAQSEDLNGQLHANTDERDTEKIVPLDTTSSLNYEVRIRTLLESEPGLSGGEISRRLGCSIPTACNWKKRIEKERKEA